MSMLMTLLFGTALVTVACPLMDMAALGAAVKDDPIDPSCIFTGAALAWGAAVTIDERDCIWVACLFWARVGLTVLAVVATVKSALDIDLICG